MAGEPPPGPATAVTVAVTTADVGVGVLTPDVKGTLLVDWAPLNAGACVARAGLGVALSFSGLSTL